MRAMVVVLAVAGCSGKSGTTATGDTGGTPTTQTTDPVTTEPGVCVSGDEWLLGDHESPDMHPGMDCIDCHESRHDGPTFSIAGTVFTAYHEPDDCYGRNNVVVEITDANGDVQELETGASGNFSAEAFRFDPVMPYTARILVDGVETNAMASAQSDGACNSCHSKNGKNAAPGRIIVGD